jgi:hypothetical protein
MIVLLVLASVLFGVAAGFVVGTAYGVGSEQARWLRRIDEVARRRRQEEAVVWDRTK